MITMFENQQKVSFLRAKRATLIQERKFKYVPMYFKTRFARIVKSEFQSNCFKHCDDLVVVLPICSRFLSERLDFVLSQMFAYSDGRALICLSVFCPFLKLFILVAVAKSRMLHKRERHDNDGPRKKKIPKILTNETFWPIHNAVKSGRT